MRFQDRQQFAFDLELVYALPADAGPVAQFQGHPVLQGRRYGRCRAPAGAFGCGRAAQLAGVRAAAQRATARIRWKCFHSYRVLSAKLIATTVAHPSQVFSGFLKISVGATAAAVCLSQGRTSLTFTKTADGFQLKVAFRPSNDTSAPANGPLMRSSLDPVAHPDTWITN